MKKKSQKPFKNSNQNSVASNSSDAESTKNLTPHSDIKDYKADIFTKGTENKFKETNYQSNLNNFGSEARSIYSKSKSRNQENFKQKNYNHENYNADRKDNFSENCQSASSFQGALKKHKTFKKAQNYDAVKGSEYPGQEIKKPCEVKNGNFSVDNFARNKPKKHKYIRQFKTEKEKHNQTFENTDNNQNSFDNGYDDDYISNTDHLEEKELLNGNEELDVYNPKETGQIKQKKKYFNLRKNNSKTNAEFKTKNAEDNLVKTPAGRSFVKHISNDDVSFKPKFYSKKIKEHRYRKKSFEEVKKLNFKENKGSNYNRINYNENTYTRDKPKKDEVKDEVLKLDKKTDTKSNDKKSKNKLFQKKTNNSFQNEQKRISKLQKEKDKLQKDLKNTSNNNTPKSAVFVTGAVNTYVESGKDDNAGVGAAYKVTDSVDRFVRKRYNKVNRKTAKRQKKLSKVNSKIEKAEKKAYFKANMEKLKKSESYQNSSKIKQFFKRREYKKRIAKNYRDKMGAGIKNRVKNVFNEAKKSISEFAAKNKKTLVLIIISILLMFTIFQGVSIFTTMITGMLNTTISTTYLSDETVLSDCNNEFTIQEQCIRDEMDSVEENHPGYDEYIVKGKEKIGHDTHQLLAYLTAKYGSIKDVSDIESELKSLIDKMYEINYKEEIEIRYKTVYYTYTDSDGNTQTGSYEEPYEYKKLIVTLDKTGLDDIVREEFKDYPNNLSHYETLVASKGNMELVFGNGSGNLSEIVNNPDFGNPGIEFDDASVRAIVAEAEKHLGKRYVFGANGPNNFDCSSFVCWTYTHSGIKNMPRTTAWGIYKNYCNPVSPSDAKAGDIIFFKNTYNSGDPISHVGIYVGGGYMIHAGDPIKYARIDTKYWKDHFYSFGRPK